MKEKFEKLGEKVNKNKGKITFVAGVAVGAVGFIGLKKFRSKYFIDVAEKIQIEGAKGIYTLYNFKDGRQVLANEFWGIVSSEGTTIQPEVIMDALTSTFGLVE